MKQTEEILSSCEHQMNRIESNEQITHNDPLSNEFLFDEQALRMQIKQKYREHLQQLNNVPQKENWFVGIIKELIIIMFAFLQQFWIQIIPQCLRGRYFAEKSPKLMNKFPQINCGNMSLLLSRMKKESKYFFIILEQRISYDECFDIEENLFDNSEQSNKKLNYILQCQTISLNAQDLIQLQKNHNPPIKLTHFLKTHTKCPLLLVCRYNFLQELKVMGEIQLSFLSKESFVELLDEVKKNIFQLKNLQSECKRQVFQQFHSAPQSHHSVI